MNKPNKTELEYFIRYSLDSDKYKRYMELYDEIERLKEMKLHTEKYASEMEDKYILEKSKNDKAVEYIEEDIKGNYFKRYDDEVYKMCEDLLDILKGVDKE